MRRTSKIETLYLSRHSSDLFIMKKDRSKWYLMTKNVDNNSSWPVMFSTNKKRLLRFMAGIGLVKV